MTLGGAGPRLTVLRLLLCVCACVNLCLLVVSRAGPTTQAPWISTTPPQHLRAQHDPYVDSDRDAIHVRRCRRLIWPPFSFLEHLPHAHRSEHCSSPFSSVPRGNETFRSFECAVEVACVSEGGREKQRNRETDSVCCDIHICHHLGYHLKNSYQELLARKAAP